MFGRRFDKALRGIAVFTAVTTSWFLLPTYAFAEAVRLAHPPKPLSMLPKGLTQTPDADLQKKIAAKEAEEKAARNRPRPDVRMLTAVQMKRLFGRGPYRYPGFCGTFPCTQDSAAPSRGTVRSAT